MPFSNVIRIRTLDGSPIRHANLTVTPEAHPVMLHLSRATIVWNRPSAIRIEQDGQVHRIPIVDLTRIVQAVLFASGLVLASLLIGMEAKLRKKGTA